MALVLGASHVFTTPGIVAVTRPLGLSIHCTGVPNYVPRDAYMPTEYWGIGRISVGGALGYLPHVELVGGAQLVLPLPDDLTLLSCSQKQGITVTVDEIVRPSLGMQAVAPWDRNPSFIGNSLLPSSAGNVGWVTAFTYTVATGKKLMLVQFVGWMQRITAATGLGLQMAYLSAGAATLDYLYTYDNRLMARNEISLRGGPVYLKAGETLLAGYYTNDTGGSIQWGFEWGGLLFDA